MCAPLVARKQVCLSAVVPRAGTGDSGEQVARGLPGFSVGSRPPAVSGYHPYGLKWRGSEFPGSPLPGSCMEGAWIGPGQERGRSGREVESQRVEGWQGVDEEVGEGREVEC